MMAGAGSDDNAGTSRTGCCHSADSPAPAASPLSAASAGTAACGDSPFASPSAACSRSTSGCCGIFGTSAARPAVYAKIGTGVKASAAARSVGPCYASDRGAGSSCTSRSAG